MPNFSKFFSTFFWLLARSSLITENTVEMRNDIMLCCWWKPVGFSQKVMLHFASILDETLSRWSSQNLISSNKIFTVPSAIWEYIYIYMHQFVQYHLLRVEVLLPQGLRSKFSPPPAYQTYSRSVPGNAIYSLQSTIQIEFFDSADSSMHLSLW